MCIQRSLCYFYLYVYPMHDLYASFASRPAKCKIFFPSTHVRIDFESMRLIVVNFFTSFDILCLVIPKGLPSKELGCLQDLLPKKQSLAFHINLVEIWSSRRWSTLVRCLPRAVVMAQLVEWSFPTPKVRGSNPVVSKYYITYVLSTVLKSRKYRKRGR